MKYHLSILSVLVVLFGCVKGNGQATLTTYDDPDAYSVYEAVIKNEWPIRVAKATRLVIQAETTEFPGYKGERYMCLKPPPGEESTLGVLITSYLKTNEKPRQLQRKFDIDLPYEVVSKSLLGGMSAKNADGWAQFYAKYPNSGGTIHMSAVGFNADKTLALVYMGHWCGLLCGGGIHHLLEKKNGKWLEIPWPGGGCSWAS